MTLENWQEFDAWNFPDPKSPKISMLVIVIVCRNKFYKCRIFVKILLLGRLTKFLLVIDRTGNVFFFLILWISENWKKLLSVNIMWGRPFSFRKVTKLRLMATYSCQPSTKYKAGIALSAGNCFKHVVYKILMCLKGLALFLFWCYL